MVCTGAKSEEESRLAARKYARIVQKLGFNTKFKDFKIQNMVRDTTNQSINHNNLITITSHQSIIFWTPPQTWPHCTTSCLRGYAMKSTNTGMGRVPQENR